MACSCRSVLMFAVALGGLVAQPTLAAAQTRCVPSGAPAHEQLAALEEDTPCPREVTINRFRVLLTRIAPRCDGETPTGVADGVTTARRLLYERGIEAGYLEITEYLDRVTRGRSQVDCDRTLALYVMRRSGGSPSLAEVAGVTRALRAPSGAAV